jgi:hypothetical protein
VREAELFFEERDFCIVLCEAELKHGLPDMATKKVIRGATGEEARAFRDGEKVGMRVASAKYRKHVDEIIFGR